MKNLFVFGVKKVKILETRIILESCKDLFESQVPDYKEEPISCDQLPLFLQDWIVGKMLWYFSNGPSVRSVLLQISNQMLAIRSLNQMIQIVQNEWIDIQVYRRAMKDKLIDRSFLVSKILCFILVIRV